MATPSSVTVPVKSAVASKVNWIAGLSAGLIVLNETTSTLQQLLPFVPANDQHFLTAGIALTGGLATIIARTFFTTALTPSSAAKVS